MGCINNALALAISAAITKKVEGRDIPFPPA